MHPDQVLLIPERVDEYIADNNPVRFIDAYVESLDLVALGLPMLSPREQDVPATRLQTC